ncbi:MAG: hypothetical protein HZB91_03795 [Elusimicrobia bacterium]|nr:hypothetical protein [Elusimicrobiota bacterium]
MSGHRRHRRRPSSSGGEKAGPVLCNSCGKNLQGLKLYYRVKTQITCEPNELSFTAEELEGDHAAEMERLARECEGRDPKELEEEVFVLLDYHLCEDCKVKFVKDTRSR